METAAAAPNGPTPGPATTPRGRSGLLPDELVDGPAGSCDLLVELIDTLRVIDRLTAKATGLLELAHETGEIEEATGVPVELWMAAAGRRTRSDRRMLTTTAVWRGKLPQLAEAFDAGRVSWAQARAVVCACVKLPEHLLSAVDDAIAKEVEALALAEPDDLVHVVSRAVASLDTPPAAAAEDRDDVGDDAAGHGFLAIQPRLDGSGGSLYGEADSYGLAVLTEALDREVPPPGGRHRDHVGAAVDEQRAAPSRRQQARHRMDALLHLAEASLAERGDATDAASPGDVGAGRSHRGRARPTPTLLLTMSLETLVGASQRDAELLTTLTGGRLKVDARTARRLIDEAGTRLRAVVVEETGQVVGVGRKQYRPPGWLREALLARDATCRAPTCATAARRCDLDHAIPWDPPDEVGRHDCHGAVAGPGASGDVRKGSDAGGLTDAGGTTDVVNLAHLCRTDHGAKTRDGWQVRGQRAGSAGGLHRWHHPRSGLTIDTAPATRQLRLPGLEEGAGNPRARGPDPPAGSETPDLPF